MSQTIDPKLLQHVERPVLVKGKVKMKAVKGGGEEPVTRRVKEAEVFAFAVRGDRVVVTTTDGRKFEGPVPKGWKPPEPPAPAGTGDDEPGAGTGSGGD